ncbi:hypothetical protein PanWU01x14_127110, partial [Parasponia andersonii]
QHAIAMEFLWEIGLRCRVMVCVKVWIRCGTGNEVVGVLRHDASKLAAPHNEVHVGRCNGCFARGAHKSRVSLKAMMRTIFNEGSAMLLELHHSAIVLPFVSIN